MSGEWTWTERQNIHSEHIWREDYNNISAAVITKMQRWLNHSWMSSFPLRSVLFLSPAGRNLPTLLRTSTKYDPLQRKLASARSDRRRWVFLHFDSYSRLFWRVMLASAAVYNLAGKVVFLDRFQHGGLRLRLELSASQSLVCCVCSNDSEALSDWEICFLIRFLTSRHVFVIIYIPLS